MTYSDAEWFDCPGQSGFVAEPASKAVAVPTKEAKTMTALEAEQWGDLHWACDVIAGRGDHYDDLSCARNMLQAISVSGATRQIQHAASITLMQGVAEAA